MDAHGAIVTKIVNVRPCPGADRIQLGFCCGNQVVVGMDVKEGDMGIFFRDDLALVDSFCQYNNLYPIYETDEEGNRTKIGGGFFDPSTRRVKAQRFRGQKSEGFWCPISYLWNWANHIKTDDKAKGVKLELVISKLAEGDVFEKLADENVCYKYITKRTREIGAGNRQKVVRKNNPLFYQHVETHQFQYEWPKIPDGSTLYVSEKLEGVSARFGKFPRYVIYNRFQTWLLKLLGCVLRLVGVLPKGYPMDRALQVSETIVGSRRVELREGTPGFHGTTQMWFDVADRVNLSLHNNETIYGELVGWTNSGASLRPPHDLKKLKDKALLKQYGDQPMYYKYGTPSGTSEFYVYRITHVHEDGSIIELTNNQARARAEKLGLKFVPNLCRPLKVFQQPVSETAGLWLYTGDFNEEIDTPFNVVNIVEQFAEGPSILDASHIREGVVVRVETPTGETYFLKQKQFAYKVMEGIIKDNDDYVDIEEAENV